MSASGTGTDGTACAGVTFSIVVVDAAQDKYQFESSQSVVLAAPRSMLVPDSCEIDFTMKDLTTPPENSSPGFTGDVTTVATSFVSGHSENGQYGSATQWYLLTFDTIFLGQFEVQ